MSWAEDAGGGGGRGEDAGGEGEDAGGGGGRPLISHSRTGRPCSVFRSESRVLNALWRVNIGF